MKCGKDDGVASIALRPKHSGSVAKPGAESEVPCSLFQQSDRFYTYWFRFVSFERKVLSSGLIEDEEREALEVELANRYLGGGRCTFQRLRADSLMNDVFSVVKEEIRFMINPELIVGMLSMVSMEDNEAIEIVGAERFSQYMGYGSSFRFAGDYLDSKPFDAMGRRKASIVAIDYLDCPTRLQFESSGLLRYTSFFFHLL
uniref:PARG catalytic Macro domain-containing protein n=1 Tax=Oryza punctata TaxID=4537 RepID=A0A0E0KLG8_ORYPU